MNLKALDIALLTKLTSLQVDNVTCLECCKYYIAPETAACGHTLCHSCWKGRRTCPSCAAPLERRLLKLNLPLQTRTEHIHNLGDMFEKLFQIKLDEFVLDVSIPEVESVDDPTKNVKDWLASSQNHFSAALQNSEHTQEMNNPIEISSSKIQIHSDSKKSKSPNKVVYIHQPQDDWDKIEQLPDVEEKTAAKENEATSNKNILSLIEENEYTIGNPRRSSRKKDLNQSEPTIRGQDISLERYSSKNSSAATDQKSNQAKQNWNNVKKMRKEFSKLNKVNRSKLNVSIEMCKKAQKTTVQPNAAIEPQKTTESESPQPEYIIEDNTPVIDQENPKKKIENKRQPETLGIVSTKNKRPKLAENVFKGKTSNNETNVPLNKENPIISDQNLMFSKNVSNLKSTAKSLSENIDLNHHILHNNSAKMSFVKKGALCPRQEKIQNIQTINIGNNITDNANTDDIEITIKIGSTQANIVIKKKTNDIQFKVNTDREVQTSLGTNGLISVNNENTDNQNNGMNNDIQQSIDQIIQNVQSTMLQKSQSTKKNTASAETRTAQYEITESVEKELSKIMECDEVIAKTQVSSKSKVTSATIQSPNNLKNSDKTAVDNNLNESQMTEDLDIFENGSTYDKNVHLLKNSYYAASEILPTAKSAKVVSHPEKRDREFNVNEEPSPKKFKSMTVTDKCTKPDNSLSCEMLQEKDRDDVAENDSMNYDVVMDQVFASIDADIQSSQKLTNVAKCISATQTKDTPKLSAPKKKSETSLIATQILTDNEPIEKGCPNEKYSENIFSIIDKETESHDIISKGPKDNGSTQHDIDNLLTPRMCQDLTEDNLLAQVDIENKDMCTPYQEQDDSDKSVVEETPQKTMSFTKPKNKTDTDVKKLQRTVSEVRNEIDNSAVAKSIINVSDSVADTSNTCKDSTMVETAEKRRALETPLTINRFVNHITHKSTPVARKSLNFDNENDDDTEQTLCPSSVVAKTTQEKEFMCEAFEKTQKSPLKMPLATKKLKLDSLKYCIAGSCLTAIELNNLKMLCRKYDWKYVDKYCKELTHLVVRVDEDNRSQRSVKYMCALAASKWIVSYEWVVNCLKTNLVVAENQYEVLDGTGEPGPKRSRLAKMKLFQGITFFCMPPFSVLDVETLKGMLEASGGRVVDEVKAVKATADAPALLLAEPEHTQEDRFMYLALELNIVPVNYEWALNCLGSYSLSSIHELLLCPSALLPKATSKWPHAIISRDSE